MAVINHIGFIAFTITLNFWPIYIVYGYVAFDNFFLRKFWRLFYLRDVYLDTVSDKIIFVDTKENKQEFDRSKILKVRTKYSISNIIASNQTETSKIYFIINSKHNLRYFDR